METYNNSATGSFLSLSYSAVPIVNEMPKSTQAKTIFMMGSLGCFEVVNKNLELNHKCPFGSSVL